MEKKKNTGIAHDDDGNIDDRRVAAWIFSLVIMGLAGVGAFDSSQEAVELVRILIWPTMLLFGVTVSEKFGSKTGPTA